MEKLGIAVTHLYGLTETYGPHVLCEMQSEWERLDPAGRASVMSRQGVPYMHAIYLRRRRREMRSVPADAETMGEVVMRGNNVMKGYFDDPEATAKRSAVAGSTRATSAWCTRTATSSCATAARTSSSRAARTSRPSRSRTPSTATRRCRRWPSSRCRTSKWGEVPKAFVTLKPGIEASEQELIEFCRENLAHFKCPEGGRVPRRVPEDVDRQDPEVQAPGEGVGGQGEADTGELRRWRSSERKARARRPSWRRSVQARSSIASPSRPGCASEWLGSTASCRCCSSRAATPT